MNYTKIINQLPFLIAGLSMLLPGLSASAQTIKNNGSDREIIGKALPPIDQNSPKVFNSASFGLG